ncbi:MAG TPA: FkbM family methyltransferase [Candidatus Omnitrophota bacterium]|nr:FkbM family methyltransferase [Candidatus Omnitrophota bacterium]
MNQLIEKISWLPYNILCRIRDNGQKIAELDLQKVGINRKFSFDVIPEDEGLSTQLRTFKIREPVNLRYYWKFVSPEDVVLDLGANIGVFSALSSNANKIISVEPLEKAIPYLKKNLEINGLSGKSEVITMAGGKKGWLFLEEDEKLNLSKIVDAENERTKKVRSEPLSYFAKKYKANLLRMDVEGYEYEILYKNIPKEINKISIEFHTKLLGKNKAEELIDYFYREGFIVEILIEDLPIRLYPLHGFLRKTHLIKRFTYVKKNLSKEEVVRLVNDGRAQKYLFLRRIK